jgi:hypothetical protein
MAIYKYGKFSSGDGWEVPTILYSPYEINQITLRVKTNDANITIDSLVEFVSGGGDADDLIEATICSDESKVAAATVLNNEWNKNQLCVDQGEDGYASLTKGTSKFSSGTYIDVAILMPGMIINSMVADSQTIAPFAHAAAAGSGKTKEFDEATPDSPSALIGKYLGVVTSVASLQYAPLLIGGN